MKRLLAPALLGAGLLLSLSAAAQNAPQRFRYLGKAGQFAVLGGEATGPTNARMLTLVIAAGGEKGPGGSDSFVITLRSDCTSNIVQLMSAQAYAGETPLKIRDGAADPTTPEPDSPYQPGYDYACGGWAPPGAPIYLDGADTARAYAIRKAHEGQ